jgi:group I intron endonuclease
MSVPCTATSCGIYQITNKLTGRRYIGQTVRTFEERWKGLKNQGRHGNRELRADWHELGPEAFEFEVLEVCPGNLSGTERYSWCNEQEIAYIGDDWRLDDLYNDGPGGGNYPRTEETCRKMSKAHTGKTITEEHKRNISENHVGMTGKKHTEEARRKMSEANKASDYCRNRPRKTCPWCGKTAAVNMFARWHGDRCKHRP